MEGCHHAHNSTPVFTCNVADGASLHSCAATGVVGGVWFGPREEEAGEGVREGVGPRVDAPGRAHAQPHPCHAGPGPRAPSLRPHIYLQFPIAPHLVLHTVLLLRRKIRASAAVPCAWHGGHWLASPAEALPEHQCPEKGRYTEELPRRVMLQGLAVFQSMALCGSHRTIPSMALPACVQFLGAGMESEVMQAFIHSLGLRFECMARCDGGCCQPLWTLLPHPCVPAPCAGHHQGQGPRRWARLGDSQPVHAFRSGDKLGGRSVWPQASDAPKTQVQYANLRSGLNVNPSEGIALGAGSGISSRVCTGSECCVPTGLAPTCPCP